MLFLFSVVFGTLGVALGKVSTACPASCVSDGLLNGQHLVRVGTSSDSSLHTTRDSRKWGGVYSSSSGLGFPGVLALRLADTLPGSCPRRAPRPPLRWKAGNVRTQMASHHGWDQNETDFGDACCGSVGLEVFP